MNLMLNVKFIFSSPWLFSPNLFTPLSLLSSSWNFLLTTIFVLMVLILIIRKIWKLCQNNAQYYHIPSITGSGSLLRILLGDIEGFAFVSNIKLDITVCMC